MWTLGPLSLIASALLLLLLHPLLGMLLLHLLLVMLLLQLVMLLAVLAQVPHGNLLGVFHGCDRAITIQTHA